MKVYYTHDIFSALVYGGIPRYFVELIRHMPATGADVEVLAGLHISRTLEQANLPHVRGVRIPNVRRTGFLRRLANRALERAVVRPGRDTVLHQTYTSRVPRAHGVKFVVTIHDMTHELFPDRFTPGDPTAAIKHQACKAADRILTVSESTRTELLRCYGDIPPEKVSVVHHGLTSLADSDSIPSAPVKTPYLLFVGTRFWYKNFDGLLRGYAASRAPAEGLDLVCFGHGPFDAAEQRMLRQLGVEGHVHQAGGDDRRLASYYRGARALIHPTICEGFGLPVLEAMGLGCPVLAANIPPLREVAADAGEFFEPTSTDSIAAAVDLAISNESRLAELSRRGRARAADFTWQRAARETFAAYQRC